MWGSNGFVNLAICGSEKSLASDIAVIGSYITAIYIAFQFMNNFAKYVSTAVVGNRVGTGYGQTMATLLVAFFVMYALHYLARKGLGKCKDSSPPAPEILTQGSGQSSSYGGYTN